MSVLGEDSASFFTLSNSVASLLEEVGKELDFSMNELLFDLCHVYNHMNGQVYLY